MIASMTFYRHRIQGIGAGGEQWITTLHSQGTGSLSSAHTAFNTFAVNVFTSALAARWSTLQGMLGTVTDQLDDFTGRNVAQAATASTHMGTATDKPQSPRSCVVIGLKTASPTRNGRGRMYLPAPTVASIGDDGNLLSAAATAFATVFGAQLTILDATVHPVIYHRSTATGTIVTSVQVGNIMGTQRRRTNKTTQTYVSASA